MGALALLVTLLAAPAAAAPIQYTMAYGGRLTAATGQPVAGPVEITVDFFRSATGDTPILATPLSFANTALTDGVFSLTMKLTPADMHTVFVDVASPVFVQITDATHHVTYPRQQYQMTPYAAKVPVDGTTVTYDASGNLTLVNAGAVAATATTIAGATGANTPSTLVERDAGGNFSGGTIAADTALKLKGTTSGNYVTLQAAPTTAATTYTLPVTPTAGYFLQTDGSGNLSWANIAGGGDMLASTWTTGGFLSPTKGGFGADLSAASGVPFFTTGTLSWLTPGTAANNLVRLTAAAKLPAVDGSLVTGLSASNITTGTLPVTAGGTGLTSLPNNGVLVGGGTALTSLTGTSNQVLTVNGSGAPTFTALTDAHLAASAGIARSKVAASSANHVVIDDASGNLTTEAQLAPSRGGTGLGSLGTAAQLLGVNAGATALEYKTVGGTANQITVTPGAGTLTLATPQNIDTGATPQFSGLKVTGIGASKLVMTDSSGTLTAAAAADVTGLIGTVGVAAGGTGATSLAANGVLLGNGTSALQTVAPGTSGNVLTSNGTTWVSQASTGANWAAPGALGTTTPNSGAFTTITTTGNVGIGSASPGYPLDVNGAIRATNGLTTSAGTITMSPGGIVSVNSGTWGALSFAGTFAPTTGTAVYNFATFSPTVNQTGGSNGTSRGLYVNPTMTAAADFRGIEVANNAGYGLYQSGASAQNYFAGNVGIGTPSPSAKLDIQGPNSSTNPVPLQVSPNYYLAPGIRIGMAAGNQANGVEVQYSGSTVATFGGGRNNAYAGIGSAAQSSTALTVKSNYYTDSIAQFLDSSSNPKITFDANGNVGIGTTSPAAKLQVAAGQVAGAYYGGNTTGAIDWNNGNVQATSVAPGTLTLSNMLDGGSYTLILTNTTGGVYTLSGSSVTTWHCTPACPSAQFTTVASYHTVLTILKAGTHAYLSWVSGL